MICYRVLFSKIGIIFNIAFFMIIPLIIFHTVVIFIFYIKYKKVIDNNIKDIAFSISHWDLIQSL